MGMKRKVKTYYDNGHIASSTTPARATLAAFKHLLHGECKEAEVAHHGRVVAMLRRRWNHMEIMVRK